MNEQHDRSIISSIQKMAGSYNADTVYLVTGTVSKIDESAGTCDVDAITGNATTEIQGVEFQAVVSDGICLIPLIGSEVKVCMSKYTDPFIVQYSEVDKMYLSGAKIQINNGNFKGLIKIEDLTNKLNNLKSEITIELGKISAAITALGGVYNPGNLSQFVKSDYENTKVTHGS